MKSKELKQRKKNREDIFLAVPSFINQILLLMNSGMILQEAFKKIAANYVELKPSNQNHFTREISNIYISSNKTGENVIAAFYRFSRLSNVKELTRVANIMMENQDKGTDLWDKLADEGEMLWQERKRMALERMRVAESKMSFPLGLLLLSLIIITAAPAMMQL